MNPNNMFYYKHICTFIVTFILLFDHKEAASIVNTHDHKTQNYTALPSHTSEKDKSLELLQRTLTSLDKGLNFMTGEYQHINLDGVIGTRIVEGQLKVLLNHIENGDYSPVQNDINIQIRGLIQKASDVSEVATFFVKNLQEVYYKRIGGILAKDFWTLDYPNKVTDPTMVEEPLYSGESMSEKDSDDCFTELLGTSGKTTEKCVITAHCWERMTAPGYRYYSLSHQLFYLQIGEAAGCFKDKFLKSAEPYVQTYCATMLKEAKYIQRAGFPIYRRDLFMEQQALCGMSGFKDFFKDDWLEKILSWQWEQGCWGEHGLISTDKRARVKREEKVLAEGCESHRTAVAISALVQYVRYIITYMATLPDN